ncbi:MAG: hypothetical protein Tsb0034_12140 [Ekhidna sp.]
MKKRRKHSRCLNCEEPLERKFNYCPNCGQENTDNHVSIGLLVREFTSNFFSLDSRFAHTVIPFLSKPGLITKAFIEGKRVYYANPIRWYLVISIIHFFFMSKMFAPTAKDKKERVFNNGEETTQVRFDSLYNLPDSVHNGWPLSGERQEMASYLSENSDLDPDEIMDTLRINDYSMMRGFVAKQLIKMNQETSASLNSYLMRQIPIIIFFILPVYALLLKLFFWRKGLYIKHLIHSIHLHSFLFFLMTFVWILALLIDDFEDIGLPAASVITFIYAVLSFRNVYKINLIWSFFRALMIGFLYSFLVLVVLLGGILISLALL